MILLIYLLTPSSPSSSSLFLNQRSSLLSLGLPLDCTSETQATGPAEKARGEEVPLDEGIVGLGVKGGEAEVRKGCSRGRAVVGDPAQLTVSF